MQTTVAQIQARLREADAEELAALERSLLADTRKGVREALKSARRRIDAQIAEESRVEGLYEYERSLAKGRDGALIVGLDEVGRGSLAGPLAVGAVVLPSEPIVSGLNDSKQIRPDARAAIADEICRVALAWTVEYVAADVIDREGISAALRRAFSGALARIEESGLVCDIVLVDGNPLHIDEREVNVVKGDAKCASIAAASIVAKTQRDALMRELAVRYPGYALDENKGYSSPHHIEAIRTLGLSEIHRRSFCRSFLQETLF